MFYDQKEDSNTSHGKNAGFQETNDQTMPSKRQLC